ncbi:MAG: 1-acyl-sn-glycerol-3-phosphate acyltransferase [Synechococcales cyanobacterium CRU_2_2]|nr:1-acyl-sn-glycerol-3-phosphate acyltransferase [Synechococcales cyanobacterium CRU_2_2]
MVLEIDPEDLARVKALNDDRVVLFPNHPTFREPVLVYGLSAKVGKPFYYMAAYELFNGLVGKFFQSIGVYSIRRGLVDRASIKQTLELLIHPSCHLVLFAEGRCSFQNDRLMPFQPGGVQLAFQAMSKLFKHQGEVPDLYALPIAIRYHYVDKTIAEVVELTMVEVERALGMPEAVAAIASPAIVSAAAEFASLAQVRDGRLRAIAERVLSDIEADYPDLRLSPAAQGSWNDRMGHLRQALLKRCEESLGLAVNQNQPVRDRAYRIQAALRDLADTSPLPATLPPSLIRKSVERLLNLDAIYEGYVEENPTPERFLDTLARFQREVFNLDEPPPKGLRKARMLIGEPINLKDWFEAYEGDRNDTIQAVTNHIQQAVQTLLDQLVKSEFSYQSWQEKTD